MNPNLNVNLHRSVADFNQFAVAGDDIADGNGAVEDDFIGRYGGCTAAGGFVGKDAAGNIHLRHQPAAENIAVGIGIGRHGHRAQQQAALRFGALFGDHRFSFLFGTATAWCGRVWFVFRAASAGRRCRLSRSRDKAAQLQAVRKRIARQIETP